MLIDAMHSLEQNETQKQGIADLMGRSDAQIVTAFLMENVSEDLENECMAQFLVRVAGIYTSNENEEALQAIRDYVFNMLNATISLGVKMPKKTEDELFRLGHLIYSPSERREIFLEEDSDLVNSMSQRTKRRMYRMVNPQE